MVDRIQYEKTMSASLDEGGVVHEVVWHPHRAELVLRCTGRFAADFSVGLLERPTTCLQCIGRNRSDG